MRRVIVFVLLCILSVCSGLYEDEAGETDWYQANIGHVTQAIFHPNQRRRLCFLASDKNVLAAIKVNTGKLAWRQVLPNGEQIGVMALKKKALFTLSDQGSARLWYGVDGSLIWDAQSAPLDVQKDVLSTELREQKIRDVPSRGSLSLPYYDAAFLPADLTDDDTNEVAVMYNNKVVVYDGASGEIIWSYSVDKPGYQAVHLAVSKGRVHVIAYSKETLKLTMTSLSSFEGEETATKTISLSSPLTTKNFAVLSDCFVVVINDQTGEVTLVDLLSPNAANNPQTIQTDLSGKLSVSALGSGRAFTIISRQSTVVYNVEGADGDRDLGNDGLELSNVLVKAEAKASIGELTLRIVHTAESKSQTSQSVAFAQLASTQQELAHAQVSLRTGQATINVVDYASGSTEVVSTSSVDFPSDLPIVRMFSSSFKTSSNMFGYRFLVVAKDDSLRFVQKNKVGWVREEALAGIRQVSYVKLPAPVDIAVSEEYPMLLGRMVPELKALANKLTAMAGFSEEVVALGDDVVLEDKFGFRKFIIAVTDAGKLFALNTENGDIVWSKFLVNPDQSTLWRVYHLKSTVSVAITQSKLGSALHYFNPLTGVFDDVATLDYKIQESLLLPYKDSSRQQLLMAVDTELNVHCFPKTSEAQQIFATHLKSIYFYLANANKKSIVGYVLAKDASGNAVATPNWSVVFPGDTEQVSGLAMRSQDESIISTVNILGGDKGLLYKYLNPNLLAVATTRNGPAPGMRVVPSVKRTTDPSICVYLIDVVTGTILDRIVQRFGQGPVHILQKENMIVYHFFNTQAHQYEMSVVELFEDRNPSTEEEFDEESFSSLSAPRPFSMQQTYVFQTGVKTMGVTATKRGITSKNVLVGLTSNQIYSIPYALLDARRPQDDPTPEEQEEGLVPYAREIPMQSTHVLSYNRTIHNIRGIECTPTVLESTSMAFVYGLDYFFTRTTPSQTFDLLNADFNHPFLICTVCGVASLIVITGHYARANALKMAWK